jgi:predicted transglutaminase-like cysteine proteinase
MPIRSVPARLWLLALSLGVGALLWCTTPALAASPGAAPSAGPRFVGYVTERSAEPARFDFARLDGAGAAEVRLIAAALARLPPRAQLEALNQRVNRVAARDDLENYGVDDHWAAPQDFFRRGGDCEDYAIAKYAVLERLGWPPERMWIVVMRETVISPIHAVLVVQHDGRLWTLDNLGDRVFEHGRIDFYRPAYSLNRFGLWSHGGSATLAAYRGTAARTR